MITIARYGGTNAFTLRLCARLSIRVCVCVCIKCALLMLIVSQDTTATATAAAADVARTHVTFAVTNSATTTGHNKDETRPDVVRYSVPNSKPAHCATDTRTFRRIDST